MACNYLHLNLHFKIIRIYFDVQWRIKNTEAGIVNVLAKCVFFALVAL